MSSRSQVPGVSITLTDNTIYQEEVAEVAATPSFNGIQVGFSAQGRDNVLLYFTNARQFLNEYGNPNYKLYGQSAYNAYHALQTNQCGMYFMRLMAEDATYANLTLVAKVKTIQVGDTDDTTGTSITALADDVVGDTEDTGLRLAIDWEMKSFENCNSVTDVKRNVAKLYDAAGSLDEEGYAHLPLFTFWSLGRGVYGNDMRVKFVDAIDYDFASSSTLRVYEIETLRPSTTGLAIIDTINGMLDDTAFDVTDLKNPSQFLEDRVNDVDYGSKFINMMVNMDSYERILTLYNNVASKDYQLKLDTFDIIFGKLVDGDDNPYLIYSSEPTVNIHAVDGIALMHGSDGSMSGADADSVKEKLLIKAFDGTLDPTLKSRFSTPADFVLDANFPDSVKRQMAALAARRKYDAMTYLDGGMLTTVSEYGSWLNDMRDVFTYNLLKDCGCYKYRDVDFTGKVIPMTVTYYLAAKLPTHMSIRGLTEPMARDNATLVAGVDYIKGTFFPVIDPDSNDAKKVFYRYHANCYESVTRDKVQRAWAITTCQEESDRSDEFNEYILHRGIKIAYDLLNTKIYKIGEESDRQAYQKQAEKEISYQLAAYLRSVSVEFVMSAQDEKQNRMRLKMRMVFKTVIHQGAVEVYLDPRVATVSSSTMA